MKSEREKAGNRIRYARYREKHLAAGQCVQCDEVATCSLLCEKHWFMTLARNHKLMPIQAGITLLRQIWDEQKSICALTGEKMLRQPGPNMASLDHKVPISRGGTNSKENLHFVLYSVNSTKADLSLDEFIEMCRSVVNHADTKIVRLRKVE